jgi:hypothetical protein
MSIKNKVSIGFAGSTAKIAKFLLGVEAVYTTLATAVIVVAITYKVLSFSLVDDAVLASITRYWFPWVGYGIIALAVTSIIYLIASNKTRADIITPAARAQNVTTTGWLVSLVRKALSIEAIFVGAVAAVMVIIITLKAMTLTTVSDATLAAIVRFWYPFAGYGLLALAITAIIYLVVLLKARTTTAQPVVNDAEA